MIQHMETVFKSACAFIKGGDAACDALAVADRCEKQWSIEASAQDKQMMRVGGSVS